MNWTQEEYDEWLKRNASNSKHGISEKELQSKHSEPDLRNTLADVKLGKSKYGAKKSHADGICFDSKREADYYCELKLRQRSGDILGFCRQPRFPLISDSGEQVEYLADFIVFNADGTYDIVDVKGMMTDVFKIKQKMFKAKYPKLELKIVR